MSFTSLTFITIVVAAIFAIEWPRITDRKTKIIFAVFLTVQWVLALVVSSNREILGPQQFIEFVMHSLFGSFIKP
ncbi:hypothetical protein [Candidatus Pristimantibacillus sp. PTI5]|uniref:hypothetical protein n=1 Tax=Candidatus Pristimantibacillus sp. PTI5 TaxID=3400422 RepID=UPI003B012DB8